MEAFKILFLTPLKVRKLYFGTAFLILWGVLAVKLNLALAGGVAVALIFLYVLLRPWIWEEKIMQLPELQAWGILQISAGVRYEGRQSLFVCYLFYFALVRFEAVAGLFYSLKTQASLYGLLAVVLAGDRVEILFRKKRISVLVERNKDHFLIWVKDREGYRLFARYSLLKKRLERYVYFGVVPR